MISQLRSKWLYVWAGTIFCIAFALLSFWFVNRGGDKSSFTKAASGTVSIDTKAKWDQGSFSNIVSSTTPDKIQIQDPTLVETELDLQALYQADHNRVYANVNAGDAYKVVDKDLVSSWKPINTNDYWQIDLGAEHIFTKMDVYSACGYFYYLYSTNGTDWTNTGFMCPRSDPGYTFSSPITARYFKIDFYNPSPFGFESVSELKLWEGVATATHTSAATQLDGTSTLQHWDTFVPDATIPANSSIAFRFRTSVDTGFSGSVWSASTAYGASINLATVLGDTDKIKRYLQVESTLTSTDGIANPALHSYAANYTRDDTCDGFDHLTLTPATASINTGATTDFAALAINGGGSSMPGVTLSYSASSGTIDGSGHYTAPSVAGTYTVTATSSCGGSVTASVTVAAPVVDKCSNFDHITISPKTATIAINEELNFTTQSFNHDGSSNESPATVSTSGGAVTTSTFMADAPGIYTITADSSCGGTDTATITVSQTKPPARPCMFGYTLLNNTWVCAGANLVWITVIAPNGGENYQAGQQLPISFKMPVLSASVISLTEPLQLKKGTWFVDIYLDTGSGYKKIITDVDYTKNVKLSDDGLGLIVDTSYLLPNDLSLVNNNAKTLARLHVNQADSPDLVTGQPHSSGVFAATDDSNQPFIITASNDYFCLTIPVNGYCPPANLTQLKYRLIILSPQGNDVWPLSSNQAVRWHLLVRVDSQNVDLTDPLQIARALDSLADNYYYSISLSTNDGNDNYPMKLKTNLTLKDFLTAEKEFTEISLGSDPALVTKNARIKIVLTNRETANPVATAISEPFEIRSHSLIAGIFDPENWPGMATVGTVILAALAALLNLIPLLTNALFSGTIAELVANLGTRFANFFGLLLFGSRKKRYRGLVYDSSSLEPVSGARVLLLKVEESLLNNQDTRNNNQTNLNVQTPNTLTNPTIQQFNNLAINQSTSDNQLPTKLIQTVITNQEGYFQLPLEPGSYRLLIKKAGFSFPSTFIDQRDYKPVDDNYLGETFKITSYSSERDLNFNLPVDNQNPSFEKSRARSVFRLNALERVLTLLNYPLLTIGTMMTALAVYTQPSVLNMVILAIYLPLWLGGVSGLLKFNSWGRVIDQTTKQPLELALVRAYSASQSIVNSKSLIDKTNDQPILDKRSTINDQPSTNFPLGKLVRTVVTNQEGRYALRLESGNYNLCANKIDYSSFKPHKIRIFKGLDYVNIVLGLMPKMIHLKDKTTFKDQIDPK